jgi:hypothetical protein
MPDPTNQKQTAPNSLLHHQRITAEP